MDNQQLKNIIKEIQQKEGVGLAEIAVQTDLDRSYLSAFIHAKVKKLVTEKMLGKLTKGYPAYFKAKQQNPTPEFGTPLPGHATLDDHIQLYRQWLADKETKYQDSHSANMKLLELLNTKLTEIESNLKTGQSQLKEQLFVVGEGLAQQLEGIASGLLARDKKAQVAKKDTGVSARQRDGDGKNKGH